MREDVFALLNRHVNVSRETCDKLVAYHDLLLKWQARVNLVSPNSIAEVWTRHFLDSVQLLNHLPSLDIKLLDIGSGAGFPGMVLAVCGVREVHLAESDQKKITFLKEVARVTETNIICHASRVEAITPSMYNVITSRACSALTTLCEYSVPNVSHETLCLFPKGRNYSKEVEDAKLHWSFQLEVAASVSDPEGVLLTLSQLTRRGHESGKSEKHKDFGGC